MRSGIRVVLTLIMATLVINVALLAQNTHTKTVTVPKNTVIPVVLDTPVNSATSKVGDRIEAHCYGSQCGGFPSGTMFVGRLTVVQPKQAKAPGKIKAEITSAVLPDGTHVAVSAVPSSKDGIPKDGATGKSAHKSRKTTGAIGGGVIGGIAGGWGGAAIGAGAGYLVGKSVEGSYTDVTVSSGTKGYITTTAPAKFQLKQ